MSTTPTSFRLPDELKRDLEKLAVKQRRSVSWVVIEALRQYVSWWKRQKQ